ncbi:hypothetical protein SLA2020_153600 [Shorea laevis]
MVGHFVVIIFYIPTCAALTLIFVGVFVTSIGLELFVVVLFERICFGHLSKQSSESLNEPNSFPVSFINEES